MDPLRTALRHHHPQNDHARWNVFNLIKFFFETLRCNHAENHPRWVVIAPPSDEVVRWRESAWFVVICRNCPTKISLPLLSADHGGPATPWYGWSPFMTPQHVSYADELRQMADETRPITTNDAQARCYTAREVGTPDDGIRNQTHCMAACVHDPRLSGRCNYDTTFIIII